MLYNDLTYTSFLICGFGFGALTGWILRGKIIRKAHVFVPEVVRLENDENDEYLTLGDEKVRDVIRVRKAGGQSFVDVTDHLTSDVYKYLRSTLNFSPGKLALFDGFLISLKEDWKFMSYSSDEESVNFLLP